MDFGTIFMIGILALNMIISIWNSYASGFNLTVLRKHSNQPLWLLFMVLSVTSLFMGFIGACYVLITALGVVAFMTGYISSSLLTLLFAYNFLVLGGLITGLGIVMTIETVAVAIKTRNKWAALASCWNIFASVWNVVTYLKNFKAVTNVINGTKDSRTKLYIIAAVAVVMAIIIVYAAYHMGAKKGEKVQ